MKSPAQLALKRGLKSCGAAGELRAHGFETVRDTGDLELVEREYTEGLQLGDQVLRGGHGVHDLQEMDLECGQELQDFVLELAVLAERVRSDHDHLVPHESLFGALCIAQIGQQILDGRGDRRRTEQDRGHADEDVVVRGRDRVQSVEFLFDHHGGLFRVLHERNDGQQSRVMGMRVDIHGHLWLGVTKRRETLPYFSSYVKD